MKPDISIEFCYNPIPACENIEQRVAKNGDGQAER
jgi:hypothetical protein